MKYLGILVTAVILSACASTTVNRSGVTLMSEHAYETVIERWSDNIEDYEGFNNTVSIKATLINPEIALAQADQNARLYQWDQVTYDNEKQKISNQLNSQTDVFVSFYSPERKWDDLHKNKTLWKIFLDVNGQRYEGKAVKIKLLPREVQKMYPYHTSFATPYLVTFPISANSVGANPARLIFTGAVGSVTLQFGKQ